MVLVYANRSKMIDRTSLDSLAERVIGDPAPPAAQNVVPMLSQALHASATDRDRYGLTVTRNIQEKLSPWIRTRLRHSINAT